MSYLFVYFLSIMILLSGEFDCLNSDNLVPGPGIV